MYKCECSFFKFMYVFMYVLKYLEKYRTYSIKTNTIIMDDVQARTCCLNVCLIGGFINYTISINLFTETKQRKTATEQWALVKLSLISKP